MGTGFKRWISKRHALWKFDTALRWLHHLPKENASGRSFQGSTLHFSFWYTKSGSITGLLRFVSWFVYLLTGAFKCSPVFPTSGSFCAWCAACGCWNPCRQLGQKNCKKKKQKQCKGHKLSPVMSHRSIVLPLALAFQIPKGSLAVWTSTRPGSSSFQDPLLSPAGLAKYCPRLQHIAMSFRPDMPSQRIVFEVGPCGIAGPLVESCDTCGERKQCDRSALWLVWADVCWAWIWVWASQLGCT